MTGLARRGQPLIALVVTIVVWVGARGVIRDDPSENPVTSRVVANQSARLQVVAGLNQGPALAADPAQPDLSASANHKVGESGAAPLQHDMQAAFEVGRTNLIAPPTLNFNPIAPPPDRRLLDPRLAGGHKLLWLAALAQLPLPDEAMKAYRSASGVANQPLHAPAAAGTPWSADGWLMLRGGGQAPFIAGAAAPSYGASQAGLVVRYRLPAGARRQGKLYVRVTAPTGGGGGKELAVGLGGRLVPAMPVVALAELRATDAGTQPKLRPAAMLVTQIPPVRVMPRVQADLYGAAGYVGGASASAFAEGQVHLQREIGRLDGLALYAGAGMWGGVQRGASRLDLGPTASLSVPLGAARGRLAADWRFRIAGRALPGSGPALTLSAGF